MTYRYATSRENRQDLASGAVLRSAPGFPAFPVRLADEMFQRAMALRDAGPATVWDPCCGSGYLLTVIALLHRRRIAAALASDIDPEALRLAEQNLALLTPSGLAARAADLDDRAERLAKPSYAEASRATRRLAGRLTAEGGDVPHTVRRADVFDPSQLRRALGDRRPDLVITDVPYGEQTSWQGTAGVPGMLRALRTVLPDDAVIAISARGRKVPVDEPANAKFKIGTRAVALFRPRA